MSYWFGYFLILFIGGGGLIAFLIRLRRVKTHPILENLVLFTFSLFITAMGLEFYFKTFFAETDEIPSLASRNWRTWYHPEESFNSLGYRDIEWTDELVVGKTKVMVIGDSFVEGLSLKNSKDRFSNILGQKLGDGYVVFNLGKGGANTKDEINAIITYPYAPDVLVLSYFINDIEGGATWERGFTRPFTGEGPSELARFFLGRSYAFNFFYWRVRRIDPIFRRPDIEVDPFWRWYVKLNEHPDVWWLHQQELISVYEGAVAQQIPLIVVVFPSMNYVEQTRFITDRVINVFAEQGVPIVDVAELVKDLPPNKLVASPVDSHPSELVNRLVAEALYDKFVALNLVE